MAEARAETLPAVADRLGVSLDRVRRVLRKNPAVEALMPRLAGARVVTPAAARAIAATLGETTPAAKETVATKPAAAKPATTRTRG